MCFRDSSLFLILLFWKSWDKLVTHTPYRFGFGLIWFLLALLSAMIALEFSYFRFQAHLLNVFDNVKNVAFHEKDYDRILAIISQEGETVQVKFPA